MRIACLLPSATDICIRLGLADFIVGVTHECNLDAVMEHRSETSCGIDDSSKVYVLTESGLDQERSNTQAEIDAQVKKASCAIGGKGTESINSIYPILHDTFKLSRPTIVFTQNICNVCAPSVSEVETLVGNDSEVKVLSLDPSSIEDVAETFIEIAKLCGVAERGEIMKSKFLSNIDLVRKIVNGKADSSTKKKVLLLEWIDPPYDAGHWIPGMIEAAGCVPLRIKPTTKSKRITWNDIYAADPDVVIVACCGFDLKRNIEDAVKSSSKLEKLRAAHNDSIFACNGDMHFTRPGPLLLEGICTIARCAYDEDRSVAESLESLSFLSGSLLQWERVKLSKSQCRGEDTVMDIEDSVEGLKDFMAIHDEACADGRLTYEDPESGYQVFTELAHKKRGKCCGSGCRHCPYNHENVRDKASKIMQPAFLYEGYGDHNIARNINGRERDVRVLFFSGGKDSFLAIRALLRSQKNSKQKLFLILLTTFDSSSRIIAHQDIHIDTVIRQATHLNIPLVGVPVIRASKEPYASRISRALDLIAKRCGGRNNISTLVFGDLYLEHIRSWREKELSVLGCQLQFPLWKVGYDELTKDLKESGIEVVLAATTVAGISVGDCFNDVFAEKIKKLKSIDLFGENGEYHTIAKVWTVSKEQALGI